MRTLGKVCVVVIAAMMVAVVFSARWGPHLDENGDLPSSYDDFDTWGFPFIYKLWDGGNCEDGGSCGGTTVRNGKLALNLAIAALSVPTLSVLLWNVIPWTRRTVLWIRRAVRWVNSGPKPPPGQFARRSKSGRPSQAHSSS